MSHPVKTPAATKSKVDEYFEETKMLVSSFLTTKLKDNPNGLTLDHFCKQFPKDSDEPDDWYIRAGKKSPLEVLKLIGDPVVVRENGYGIITVSLNQRSDKVVHDMADMVKNQKTSTKKRGRPNPTRPHYLKARDSFDMNRRYSNSSSSDRQSRTRLSYNEHSSRNDHSSNNNYNRSRGPPSTPPIYANSSRQFSWGNESSRQAPGDPRVRSSATSIIPPQVRPPQPATGPSPAKQPAPRPTSPPSRSTQSSQSVSSSRSYAQNSTATSQKPSIRKPDDPTLDSKKSAVRERLLNLLTKKHKEVKIIYLNSLLGLENYEKIDPVTLGHKTFTSLFQDTYFSEYIKIGRCPSSGLLTVSARNTSDSKENIALNNGNPMSGLIDSSNNIIDNGPEALNDRSNHPLSQKEKYKAIHLFNFDKMIQTLDPMRDVKELPLGNNEVVDCIKYRTMRIIFKSQNPKLTLKLDDWEIRYQQEWNCKSKIQIRDFGFRTLLEFFKYLATQLPIKVRLNNHDQWVAVGDLEKMSGWLKKKMEEGSYKAITAIDAKYEQIAFPNEKYTHLSRKDLPDSDTYFQAIIMSVKMPHRIWIQIRTQKRIEDHLSIEASLVCYEDYKRKGFFNVPDAFLKPGFPCVAYDEVQQRWCRAIILKVTNLDDDNTEGITAFLVDYAITKSFSKSQLLCILKSHLKRPIGLIYAQLHSVPDESTTAKRILQEYTSPPVTLACKIISSLDIVNTDSNHHLPKSCYTVTLIDTSQGKDRNIAEDINSYMMTPDD